MDCSLPGSSVHGDSIGKNTGVGCHFLLQGIFPNQEPNPGLLHCRQILYQLSYEGSPILPWLCIISALTGVREHSEVWLWLSLGPGLRGLHCNSCYKTISLFSFLRFSALFEICQSTWDQAWLRKSQLRSLSAWTHCIIRFLWLWPSLL